jgi:hypothetical protein
MLLINATVAKVHPNHSLVNGPFHKKVVPPSVYVGMNRELVTV